MGNLPNIVFLPGLLDDQAVWVDQIEGLVNSANPIGLDLVDHERISECAQWVLKSAPQKFALVGFSMGGYVAFEILRQAPHRVEKLALVSTSARADVPERTAEREKMIVRAEAGEYEALVDELIPLVLHASRADDKFLIDAIRDMALRIGYQSFVRQLKLIMSRPDSRNDLTAIVCPTLIIVGREDTVTPPALSREMADGIQGSELVLLDNCNHYSPMEQPELVSDALKHWLANS